MGNASHSTFTLPPARADLYESLAVGVLPRDPCTVTKWADEKRYLSSKASGEPGKYNSARTPHLREIMDCLSADSPVASVVIMKPAQGGATEIGLNWAGYVIEECPASMLIVVPTLEFRKRWVRQRLNPMLETTPTLAAIFDAKRSRDGGNGEDLKDFPGGMMILGGANSAASLSSMPIRFFLGDEVDRFPWEVGGEGDPITLIEQRQKTFVRRKRLLISTPTIKGRSRIEIEYLVSDQRRLYVPCPHCSTYIQLLWKHPDGSLGLEASKTTGRVWYICRSCGSAIEEYQKTAMLEGHRWIPKFPERKARGYHWNGLYSPIGLGNTWREMLDAWEIAQNDTTKLVGFFNTELGEVYEEKGEGVAATAVQGRVEQYPEGLKFDLVVAFVDVQKDRLEFTVYGFKRHTTADGKPDTEEAWAIDHVVIPGDTTAAAVWDELDAELAEAGVQIAGVDSGYNAKMVYDFVATRPWCVATKGVTGSGRPLVEDERKRRQRLRRRRQRGVPVEPIGVDDGKTMLYARLLRETPGPGFIHYPDTPAFDTEFFAQLTAEQLVTKSYRGRPYTEWVKTRARNEALDCGLGAIAVFHLASVLMPRAPMTFAGETAPVAQQADGPRRTSQSENRGGEFSL